MTHVQKDIHKWCTDCCDWCADTYPCWCCRQKRKGIPDAD